MPRDRNSSNPERRNAPGPPDFQAGSSGVPRASERGLLRHAKVTTTLDLYSQSIDAAKLEAQEGIALAIKSTAAAD
jgi:hypothetical protein